MRRILQTVALAGMLSATAVAAQAETQTRTLGVDGRERVYLLHIPARLDRTKPVPLVLLFHGGGGSAAGALTRYGWVERSESAGFIVAAPQGVRAWRPGRHVWNDGSGRGRAARRGVDDVAFVRSVIADVQRRHRIDPRRIYATGFSMGASMSHLLGQRLGDRLAAIAPVSGHIWRWNEAPAIPVSVFYIFGTADPISPMAGGRGRIGGVKPPVVASATAWRRWLACPTAPARRMARGVSDTIWKGCRGGTTLRYVLIPGMGHHWAGGRPSGLPERWVGPRASTPFDATREIWAFFAAHPKR